MRKITICTTFFLSLISIAFSQNVSCEEASIAAKSFFQSQNKTFSHCAKIIGDKNNPLLYIFNAEDAFVIVSGDKSCIPILAYIDYQKFIDNDTNSPFNMWLNNYITQIEYLKKYNLSDEKNLNHWTNILNGKTFNTDSAVEPLVLSRWDQNKFYNYYCPKDLSGPNGRVVTGCVATALAQLIYYFRFPETGVGQYSYTDEHYGVQTANYGETIYNFDAMCDVPTCINPEISKLMYHCGVGVDMVYGPNGSGMYNHSAAKVLRTYFKYAPETEYLYRDSTDMNWDSVIVRHLNKNIPLYYAGWSLPNVNGHAFICDGYKMVDSNYYFHFNFGWGGYMDGYFYTDNLFVGGSNFNLAQELIVNGYPDTMQYDYPEMQPISGNKTLIAMQGTFTDGSQSNAHYPQNMDYTWHIKPQSTNIQSISLKISYNISLGDTLKLYAQNNPNNIYYFTNSTDFFEIELEAEEVFFQFTSDTLFESTGFRVHYTTKEETFCLGMTMFNSPSGAIGDGSGDAMYNNFSDCRFRIMATSYSALTIHINYLDLEENHDFIHFYKNVVSENNRLLSLTGHIEDTTIIFEANRMTIILETDESGTADGFSLDYTAGYVGVSDLEDDISVFPNPTKDIISIASAKHINYTELFSADGRKIFSSNFDDDKNYISLIGVPIGMYILKIYAEDGIFTKKVLKK